MDDVDFMKADVHISFSIIIPAYNAERTIDRCIESILAQKMTAYEVIVVNDGSTDKTADIISEYANKYPNMRLISISNRGVSNARNIGIDMAKGKWIVFVDADDELEPGFLCTSLDILKNKIIDTICFNGLYVYENEICEKMNRIYPEKVFNTQDEILELIRSLYIDDDNLYSGDFFRASWGKVYSAKIIKENSLVFPLDVKIGEDAIFLVRYLSFAHNIVLCNKYVYRYYRTNESVVGRFKSDFLDYQKNEYQAMIVALSNAQIVAKEFAVSFWHKAEKNFIENELKAPYSHCTQLRNITYYLSDNTVRKYLMIYDQKGIKSLIRSYMEKYLLYFPLALIDYWIIRTKKKR